MFDNLGTEINEFRAKADFYRKTLEAERAAREAQDKTTIELLYDLKGRYETKINSYMAKDKNINASGSKNKGTPKKSGGKNDSWGDAANDKVEIKGKNDDEADTSNADGAWVETPSVQNTSKGKKGNKKNKNKESPNKDSASTTDAWGAPTDDKVEKKGKTDDEADTGNVDGAWDETPSVQNAPKGNKKNKNKESPNKDSASTSDAWGAPTDDKVPENSARNVGQTGNNDDEWGTDNLANNNCQDNNGDWGDVTNTDTTKKQNIVSTSDGGFTKKESEDLLRKLSEANQERDELTVKVRGLRVDYCSAREEIENQERKIMYLTQRNSRLEADLIHSKNLIRTLKDSCAFVESQAKTFEVRHDTVVMSKADMERELINIKEESSRHITTINRLQKSNEKLSRAFIQSAEAHDQTRAELEMFQRESARRLLKFKEENDRLVVQNNQLTKLIDLINKKR